MHLKPISRSAKTTNEHKTIINKGDIYKLMWQFQQRWLLPLDVNSERLLFWMLQSGEYIPDTKFGMSSSYGIPVKHMRAFMFMVNNPTAINMDQVHNVFCFLPGLGNSIMCMKIRIIWTFLKPRIELLSIVHMVAFIQNKMVC